MIVRDLNHSSIIDEIASGKVLMGVEPMISRRFYTNLRTSERQKLCGEKVVAGAFLVRSCQVIEGICLLASLVFAPFIIGWWTVLLVPLLLWCWLYGRGQVSLGTMPVLPFFLVFIGGIIIAFARVSQGLLFPILLVLIVSPVLFAKCSYMLSEIFLRRLVLRNEKAFQFFACTPDQLSAVSPMQKQPPNNIVGEVLNLSRGVLFLDAVTKEDVVDSKWYEQVKQQYDEKDGK